MKEMKFYLSATTRESKYFSLFAKWAHIGHDACRNNRTGIALKKIYKWADLTQNMRILINSEKAENYSGPVHDLTYYCGDAQLFERRD